MIRLRMATFVATFILGVYSSCSVAPAMNITTFYKEVCTQDAIIYVPQIRTEPEIFLDSVKSVSKRLGVPYTWFLAIISHESNGKKTAVNSISGATGLIQFIPSTAKRLNTTTYKLSRMSRISQLTYCEKYFMKDIAENGKYRSLVDMYVGCFLPTRRSRVKNDSSVITQKGEIYYTQNKGLDSDKNGLITVKELRIRVEKKL
jgi:Transglycosylase SLT domain